MNTHRIYDFRNMHYRGEEGKLIPLLQKAQNEDGYLRTERLIEISNQTGIPLSQIFGVATFYAQFRFNPVGKHVIRVCHGTACHVSNVKAISEELENHLGIKDGETTADRLFTLETVSCLGCCSLAPVIMIDNTTYGNLNPNEAKKIVKHYQKEEK